MNILILSGSPRKGGNTDLLVEAFVKGASPNHCVEVVSVHDYKVNPCMGCNACFKSDSQSCVQKDDMQFVYHELQEAEMLVIASPIYYHGLSGQLKCTIDRFYAAAYPNKPAKLKKVAMFLSSGDPDMYDGALFSYQGDFLDYLQLEDMGVFTTHGYDPGVPEEKLEELRRFGESLK